MNKKCQIFISSTYRDLINERQAAVEAVLKQGHIPAGMELFAAGDESQLETIKRWIDDSDIYMLILGGRYGTIEPKSKNSYIEVEYDYAIEKKKPYFAMVINDEALKERERKLGADVVEVDNPEKYEVFREKVLSKICSFFSDDKDVKLCTHESIPDLAKRPDIHGWISGKDLPDVKGYMNLIDELQKENTKGKKAIEILEKQIKAEKGAAKGVSIETLYDNLSKIMLETDVLSKAGADKSKYSLLTMFDQFKEGLVLGIRYERLKVKVRDFMWIHVFPKLKAYQLVDFLYRGSASEQFVLLPKGEELSVYIEERKSK